MSCDVKVFLSHMKKKREELGYSYQDLSKRTGISSATLYRYETRATSVPLDKLYIIFKALGTDARDLFEMGHEFGHLEMNRGDSVKQLGVKTAARNQKMINQFNKLSDKKKKMVEELINSYFDEDVEDEEEDI